MEILVNTRKSLHISRYKYEKQCDMNAACCEPAEVNYILYVSKETFAVRTIPNTLFALGSQLQICFYILRTVTIECIHGIEIIVIVVLISADYKK